MRISYSQTRITVSWQCQGRCGLKNTRRYRKTVRQRQDKGVYAARPITLTCGMCRTQHLTLTLPAGERAEEA
ncbi:MAG: hypothetical protein CMK74_15110 [Pseudomonadales bacterium]|nr:hypothetical protein [Pseudomonadales bacterium]